MVAEHTRHLIFSISFFPYRCERNFAFPFPFFIWHHPSVTGTIIHLHVFGNVVPISAVLSTPQDSCYVLLWLSCFLFNCRADESQGVVSTCLNIYSVSDTIEDPLPKRFSSILFKTIFTSQMMAIATIAHENTELPQVSLSKLHTNTGS